MVQKKSDLLKLEKVAYAFIKFSFQGSIKPEDLKCPNGQCKSKNIKESYYNIYCNEERRNYTLKHGTSIQNSKISYLTYIRFLYIYFIERKMLNYTVQSQYILINRRHLSKLFNKHCSLMKEYTSCPNTVSCKKTSILIKSINKYTNILKEIGIL